MGKIVRREFMGSRLILVILFLTCIGIPVAVVYLLECLVTVEDELENPSEFLEQWKSGGYREHRKAGT